MKLKSIFASVFALAMLASCSQENFDQPNGGTSGEDTYVSFSFRVGDEGTRADTDAPGGTPDETLASEAESVVKSYAM